MIVLAAGCGHAVPTASQVKIVGGSLVTAGDPVAQSTVALLQPSGWTFCSGTLIDTRHVVTAGHCVAEYTDDSMFVYFGLDSSQAPSDSTDTIAVAKMTAHPQYNQDAMKQEPAQQPPNDISILELSSDAPQGFVPAAILPASDALQIGETLELAGFGLTSGDSKDTNGLLREVGVPLASIDSASKEISYGPGANGKGSCNGDSGGPAFVQRGGKLVLVGATSRGDEACTQSGIYTDVRQFTDWLVSEGASL